MIYDPNVPTVNNWDQAEGYLRQGLRVALDLTKVEPADVKRVMTQVNAGISEHCSLAFKPKGLRKYWLHPKQLAK